MRSCGRSCKMALAVWCSYQPFLVLRLPPDRAKLPAGVDNVLSPTVSRLFAELRAQTVLGNQRRALWSHHCHVYRRWPRRQFRQFLGRSTERDQGRSCLDCLAEPSRNCGDGSLASLVTTCPGKVDPTQRTALTHRAISGISGGVVICLVPPFLNFIARGTPRLAHRSGQIGTLKQMALVTGIFSAQVAGRVFTGRVSSEKGPRRQHAHGRKVICPGCGDMS